MTHSRRKHVVALAAATLVAVGSAAFAGDGPAASPKAKLAPPAKPSPKTKSPKAHEHGLAKLDVAVDGATVSLELEVPGDGIYGFEHKPKSDADKQTVVKAVKHLREDAATLFVLPAELGCKVTDVDVESAQADAAEGKPKDKDDHPSAGGHSHADGGEHADVDAGYTFECAKSPAGAKLRLGLLKAFPRVGKVKVQVVTATGQSGLTVTSDQDAISL